MGAEWQKVGLPTVTSRAGGTDGEEWGGGINMERVVKMWRRRVMGGP